MTPYMMMVLGGFAAFVGVLGQQTVRTLLDDHKAAAAITRPAKPESSS